MDLEKYGEELQNCQRLIKYTYYEELNKAKRQIAQRFTYHGIFQRTVLVNTISSDPMGK